MLSKNTLKFIKSLQIKKYRDEEGLFIVEGRKSVLELAGSGFDIVKVFCTKNFEKEVRAILGKLVDIEVVNYEELESISRLESNDSMLAVVKKRIQNFIEIDKIENVVILDQISDPGNLGTIIRTADWFGIQNIICSNDTVDFYSPKVITSTMGSFTRVNVCYGDLNNYIEELKTKGFVIYGALLNGSKLHQIENKGKFAIVIGNESKGISSEISKKIDTAITIEGHGQAESLNASVAAAIIMYHFRTHNG